MTPHDFQSSMLAILLLATPLYADSPEPTSAPVEHTEEHIITTPRGLRMIIPEDYIDQAQALVDVAEYRLDTFFAQCHKWQRRINRRTGQPDTRCEDAVRRSVVELVPDYSFYCPLRPYNLCRGRWFPGDRHIVTVLFERKYQCAEGFKVRTRQDMMELGHGAKAWLTHWSESFCGDTDNVIPVLVHELCHNFGRNLGHVSGFEECQPVRR
jgi:hypothetical protein